ncbi:MAG: hypothetical protein WBA46_09490 [Thermomicrobiales bacterium]
MTTTRDNPSPTTIHDPSTRTDATSHHTTAQPATTTHPIARPTNATTQDNPGRSLPTYDAVERIHALPGVRHVNVFTRCAVAYVDHATYERFYLLEGGDSPEDALAKLEQAVRDAYMAVS